MMNPGTDSVGGPMEIVDAVRLAFAPIFLLVATAGLLNVMTMRLGRIVDRVRVLEERIDTDGTCRTKYSPELTVLEERIVKANRAITSCVISCVLVCVMVITLFVGALFSIPIRVPIALIFMIVMLMLSLGVSFFLREIMLANKSLHVRKEFLEPPVPRDETA